MSDLDKITENSLNIKDSKDLTQNEKYQNISSELIKLKNLIKGGQSTDYNKKNILEYILYPELISINEIKNKIYKLFNVKSNDELQIYLLGEINTLFQKEKTVKNSTDEITLRGQFYKILEVLNYFISHSLIYFSNNNNNKSFEYFNKWILFDNRLTKSILNSYINIFNLKCILYDFYALRREILLSISDNSRILYLISILNLQNIFPFKYIVKVRNQFFEQNVNVYELYNTYNTSMKEISNLTDFLKSFNTNWIQPSTVEKIINDIDIKNKMDDKIKCILIEELMVNYSLNKEKDNNKEKETLCYYRIVSNNIEIISNDYFIDWSDLNTIFKNYLDNKDYDKNIGLLNGIKNVDVIKKYMKEDLIFTLSTSIPIGKISLISRIIRSNTSLINYLLNTNRIRDGLKLIKILKLNKSEYDSLYDEISINNFLIYKINSCIDNSFDTLVDFGMINETVYNKLMYKLMKKTYLNNSVTKNNNDYQIKNDNNNMISLNEDDEETKVDYQKNVINDLNNFDNLNQFFLKESNERNMKSLNDSKKNNILTQTDKEKILCLYNFAKLKNYKLTKYHQKIFDEIFQDVSSININYNKYIPEDKYEPHDPSCIFINTKIQKISFIDNIKSLKVNYNFFKKSKYIGIDSEWRQPFCANNKENASILQLSNYSERNVMIIDLLKMKTDDQFFNLFEEYFKDKTFIGYAFNRSDIEQFNEQLQNMFKNAKIIDLIDIYQHKFLKKATSLKDMCKEFLGSNLCKYEQCSNWENRPLKKRQLHYAALDAIVCISLFKKMTNSEGI